MVLKKMRKIKKWYKRNDLFIIVGILGIVMFIVFSRL
ncbi:putative negative regulator of RcsB-dependent stress response [Salirhabdus euzebyi]|uniref:Putative negative regulator of RcsB-dependent stress response n=1 Tax=Salirhabdus euzebyi TaxID=394506 RepID=A0A841PYK2_9BACI|nr:putative negative regulator of RcsB-dependent stress response [Salirhabdus euzebyi]